MLFRVTRKRVQHDESGQVLVLGFFFIVGLCMAAITVANVGLMVAEKIRVQDSVDAAAYSAAVVEARYMNLSAYINRALIANYDAIAFNMGLWATVDAYDHGSAAALGLLYELATILNITAVGGEDLAIGADGIDSAFHKPMHTFNNKVLARLFGHDEKNANRYIEKYNTDILAMYQGLLYTAMQSVRHNVIEKITERIDPGIETSTLVALGMETVNYDELESAVDYNVQSSNKGGLIPHMTRVFDSMAGTDSDHAAEVPVYLGALTESSLDRFAAGKLRKTGAEDTLRNFNTNTIIPHTVYKILEYAEKVLICWPAKVAYTVDHLGFSSFSCTFHFSMGLGGEQRYGYEDNFSQTRVPIVADGRIRQVNTFGLRFRGQIRLSHSGWLDFGKMSGGTPDGNGYVLWGYSSAPRKWDIANYANNFYPDEEERMETCLEGIIGSFPKIWRELLSKEELRRRARELVKEKSKSYDSNYLSPSSCNLNKLNSELAARHFMLEELPYLIDPHWDGSFDGPFSAPRACDPINDAYADEDIVLYPEQVAEHGHSEGAPPYEFETPLSEVGFPKFHYRWAGSRRAPDNSRRGAQFNGPSVGVIGVKPKWKVRTLRWLGLGNSHPITALARAQVYYLANPYRPAEMPSLFNPYWAARLAPLESPDTPPLLKNGIPFVAGTGAVLKATH